MHNAFKLYKPDLWFESAVVVDGIARSGKALLASCLSFTEQIEPWQLSAYVDHVFKLWELNLLRADDAVSTLRIALNDASFNYAIGRMFNSRNGDDSSVQTFGKSKEFSSRALNNSYEELEHQFLSARKFPLFHVHEQINALELWESAVPRLRMIEVVRNPFTLFASWESRGLGTRWGIDPKLFVPVASANGQPIPTFALGVEKEWFAATGQERILIALEQQFNQLAANMHLLRQPSSFLPVKLEALKSAPRATLESTLDWIGVQPKARDIDLALEKLNLPRVKPNEDLKSSRELALRAVGFSGLKRLEALEELYETIPSLRRGM